MSTATTHTAALSNLAARMDSPRYLEIGVRNRRDNFDFIRAPAKIGIDPASAPEAGPGWEIRQQTSDEFFASPGKAGRFDLVFLDGDHSYPQCLADLQNALAHLAPGGIVCLHDTWPTSTAQAAPVRPAGGGAWSGEVWRAILWARQAKLLVAATCPDDHGISIVTKRPAKYRHQIRIAPGGEHDPATFSDLSRNRAHRDHWMGAMGWPSILTLVDSLQQHRSEAAQ